MSPSLENTPSDERTAVPGADLLSRPSEDASPSEERDIVLSADRRLRSRSAPGVRPLPVLRMDGALVCTLTDEYDHVKALSVLRGAMGLSHSTVVTLRHTDHAFLVDGQPARTVDFLRAGQTLTVRLPEPPPQPLAPYDGGEEARVVLEDDWVVVYDKPPHMPTHPAHSHQTDTLANVFAQAHPSLPFRAVGRLDADTSGLIVIAKDSYVASWLPERIQKTYLAMTGRVPEPPDGVIDAPLIPLDQSDGGCRVSPDGLRAVTRYRVVGVREGRALIECELETGRTHQIRAHLSYIGCPLLGDARYGGDCSVLRRHALHCAAVRFPEPDGTLRALQSPPPFWE